MSDSFPAFSILCIFASLWFFAKIVEVLQGVWLRDREYMVMVQMRMDLEKAVKEATGGVVIATGRLSSEKSH